MVVGVCLQRTCVCGVRAAASSRTPGAPTRMARGSTRLSGSRCSVSVASRAGGHAPAAWCCRPTTRAATSRGAPRCASCTSWLAGGGGEMLLLQGGDGSASAVPCDAAAAAASRGGRSLVLRCCWGVAAAAAVAPRAAGACCLVLAVGWKKLKIKLWSGAAAVLRFACRFGTGGAASSGSASSCPLRGLWVGCPMSRLREPVPRMAVSLSARCCLDLAREPNAPALHNTHHTVGTRAKHDQDLSTLETPRGAMRWMMSASFCVHLCTRVCVMQACYVLQEGRYRTQF